MDLPSKLIKSALAAGTFAVALTVGASAPALAQNGALYGAAAGAVIGALLFDSGRNQHYYVRNNRRVYVSDGYAQNYYRHRDPQFYRQHQSDWQGNRQQFVQDWNGNHGGNMHGNGYNGNGYNGNGHGNYNGNGGYNH